VRCQNICYVDQQLAAILCLRRALSGLATSCPGLGAPKIEGQ
jgi:hypothetical protein